MAVWLSGRETVYLERHSYKPDGNALSGQQIRTNILKLGRVLKLPVFAKRLHSHELLGLIEFPTFMEVGFVYRLPYSLGQRKRGFPIQDMNIRKPRDLLSRWKGDPIPALGLRFDLVRKLVQSVSFLHASGWLHKNIRTDELYIFPKSGLELSREWEGMDFENLFLLGYRYSRPDVVLDKQQHQPNQQKVQDDAQSLLPSGALPPGVSEVPMSIQSQEGQASLEQSSEESQASFEPPSRDRANLSTSKARELKIKKRRARFAREDIVDSDSDLSTSVLDRQYEDGWNEHRLREDTRKGDTLKRGKKWDKSPLQYRVNLDIKHRPYKRAYQDRRYCHAFDVYSLGVALFEIGMWRTVEELYSEYDINDDDPFEARRKLIRAAQRMLPVCGERYTKVIVACLNVDPEDSEESLAEQRELCARTAADLAQCQV
ncbi:hypothetical protein VE02_02787 [Pseudogymnoascus sp. 03VT05]|nr:hypothetical protein VE02_02787 [Pseudogymnoascus sp. 03VT05]